MDFNKISPNLLRSDESYGVDVSWTAAADSMCNMDPSKIILENVGRNFQGNYSCQVAILQPIVNINLSLLIIFTKYPSQITEDKLYVVGQEPGWMGTSF